MPLSISVVIMTYNEVATLDAVAREIITTLEGLERDYEVIIVDDGSTDGSKAIAEGLVNEYCRIRLICHETNLGLGGVYRTGFTRSRSDLITFFPADGQFPACILLQFVPLMDSHDLVLGYLPECSRPFIAKILSRAERIFYSILFGILPKFQGVFMFRRTILNEIHLQSVGRGWAVVLELIVKASRRNCRLISIPTQIRPRISGKSKVNNLRTVLSNFYQAIELRRFL
jgi:dolichol-phosphate mannosyltransferase